MSRIITRKSRASIRGKLRHYQTYMRHFSHRRNKLHSHHETHLHTMKDVTILIPIFHGLRKERGAYKLGPTEKKKKKRPHFKSLAFLKQARLIRHAVLKIFEENLTKFLSNFFNFEQLLSNFLAYFLATF